MKRLFYPDLDSVDRLDAIMRKYGSDQRWADVLGVERKTVLGWRHGYRVPNVEVFRRICIIAGASADEILGITKKN